MLVLGGLFGLGNLLLRLGPRFLQQPLRLAAGVFQNHIRLNLGILHRIFRPGLRLFFLFLQRRRFVFRRLWLRLLQALFLFSAGEALFPQGDKLILLRYFQL